MSDGVDDRTENWLQRALRERLGDGHALCLGSGGEYMTGIQLSIVIKLFTSQGGALQYVDYISINLISEILTKEICLRTQWDILYKWSDWQILSLLIWSGGEEEEPPGALTNGVSSCRRCSDMEPSVWGVYEGPASDGNGTLLQYSCLENPMGGGAW